MSALRVPANQKIALRSRGLLTLAGERPARGAQLAQPLPRLDNCQILINQGLIEKIGKKTPPPPDYRIIDLGEVCLIPPIVNAHTHLQLSWLKNTLPLSQGFTPWLKAMVSQLPMNEPFQHIIELQAALADLLEYGTGLVGDVGGSIYGALSAVRHCAQKSGIEIIHFCEWFGFGAWDSPWPQRSRDEIGDSGNLAPAGHALYSTSPEILRNAHAWCLENRKVFAMHLAESPEETELLSAGSGPLYEFYRGKVLPPDWQPPRMRPFAFAKSLGLLAPGTLAVHGAQLDDKEIDEFAATGAALCLCPRSNANLGVGLPNVKKLLASQTLLCLGTDGLTSCSDLDCRKEAIFLREKMDISPRALIRMLTGNGAAALGRSCPGLRPGAPASFSILPRELEN